MKFSHHTNGTFGFARQADPSQNPKSHFLPTHHSSTINIKNMKLDFVFKSSDHLRYENGRHVSGPPTHSPWCFYSQVVTNKSSDRCTSGNSLSQ
ncbi:MAG: hypothetical protein FJX80_07340 [Bacteroidetes bacterium]|nr:hypothetical protein [Bacteroidota bacterium]